MSLRRQSRRLRHFRRTACCGVAVVGAVTVAAAVGAPAAGGAPGTPSGRVQAAAEPFNKGRGNAIAEAIKLDPVYGGLSFGVTVGLALANHQNTGAIAESRSASLGTIGTSLAATPCDGGEPTLPRDRQPGALRVESTDEGAEAGKADQDPIVPGIDRQARATTAPFAEAITTAGNLDVPGALTIRGARATASSGVDGEVREAIARAEVGSLAIAGVVELRGMAWEAIHRTGAVDEQIGTFTLGSLVIGGVPVPIENPLEALAQVNDVLRTLGLELRPPRVHYDETAGGTITTVDPLGIRIIPNDLRDGVLSPILSELQPQREQLFDALIDIDCGNANYITILDVVLNAFGPGGYLAIELGGVQASTAELERFGGLGVGGGNLPPLGGNLPASGTLGGGSTRTGLPGSTTSSGTGTGSTTPSVPPTTAGTGDESIDSAVETAGVSGSRGGTLAAVAGAGLLLLAATAEGDRRKMRRAMREIPMEA